MSDKTLLVKWSKRKNDFMIGRILTNIKWKMEKKLIEVFIEQLDLEDLDGLSLDSAAKTI